MRAEQCSANTFAVLVLSLTSCLALRAQSGSPAESQRERDEWTFIYTWLSRPKQSENPRVGFVPDETTATAIGAAITRALYGEDVAHRQRPFRARLRAGVWTVMGSMRPQGAYGGVAIVQLRKADGRVIFATHTQ